MNQNHDPFIHRLPPEIVSRIFFHYSRVNKSFTTSAKTNTLFLGAVCRSWRQLAWATPELWNSFFIGYGIVSRWSEDMNRRWGDEVYRAMTDVLNKHSARWYDMDLAISERHLHLFSGIALEKKSILRRLVLSTKLTRSEAALVRFKMNCSPIELKLASLSLEYVDILWDNLTVVHLSSLPVDEFFEVLQRCPNITTITLQKTHSSFRHLHRSQHKDPLSSSPFLRAIEHHRQGRPLTSPRFSEVPIPGSMEHFHMRVSPTQHDILHRGFLLHPKNIPNRRGPSYLRSNSQITASLSLPRDPSPPILVPR
ncbi:hypothetical protein M413DRAFT_31359 [Hebeloma cylindrosporum]|uniref:Uncharacterized protein n=1 Tax=Hebeloma cylindrosporum TaxID=76867 RepID=A0A0C2XGE2_HEBCY|nr:hypothetical protein M413DRAFT_31359 [Hebeloma cylindrosporum h7]